MLVGTLACVLLALVLTSTQEKSYTASATVRVEPVESTNANDLFEAGQRLSRSYAEIYTQGAVIARMTRYMPGQAPADRSELAAQQVKDLDLLEVSGVASDRRRAVAIANAGARALEDFSARERLTPITPATLPAGPSAPNVRTSLVLALVAGFVLSAGVALLLDALLQPIPGPDELEQFLGVPVFAVIPRLDLSVGPDTTRTGAAPRDPDRTGAREVAGVGASSRRRSRGERS